MKSKSSLAFLSFIVLVSMLMASCTPAAAPTTAAPQAPAATQAPAQPAAGSAEPVKVGALLPITGQDALEGAHHMDAHRMAVEEINAAGGIKCLDGAHLELVPGDTQGKPEAGNSETERLITNDKVIAVMGAFHSGVTLPTTEISEKYEVPYLVPNAIAGSITGRGLKYVFKTRVALESYADLTSRFAKDMGAKTAVSMTSNITIGEEAKKAYASSVPAAGLQMLDEVVYQSGSPDLSDAILKMKAADPDVIFAIANAPDAILLIRQMQAANYWPKMGMLNPGGGMADPTFMKDLQELSEGITFAEAWSPLLKVGDTQAVNERFQKKFGYPLSGATATTYATTHLLAAALEKSCSRDPKKLAEVLRTTDFKEGAWNFMFPNGIAFNEKGYVKEPLVVVLQIQNQQQVPVWPADMASGKVVWPVPDWSAR